MRRLWDRFTGRDLLLAELTEMTTRVVELHDQNVQLREDNDWLRHVEAHTRALFDQLVEPGQVDGCTKVRLRDETEAEAFARHVERETGDPEGTLIGYRCRYCPRQPVTLDKFWHVTHRNPALRGKRAKDKYRTNRRRELGGFTPADLARMNERMGRPA